MGTIRVDNLDSRPMTGQTGGQTVTIPSGDSREFADLCSAISYINSCGRGLADDTGGELTDAVNRRAETEGCSEQLRPAPVQVTEGTGEPGVIGGTDTPQQQQAPAGQAGASMEVQNPQPGEPGDARQPTEVLHDRENPQSEGAVREGAVSQGATPQEADEAADRARRGDPPANDPRVTHSGDQGQQRSHGGDPVDLYSGLLSLHSVDLDVPTPFLSLQLQRRYLSGRPYYGPWGFNWDHNWNVYLRVLKTGDVARWNGRLHEDVFRDLGDHFEPPHGVFELMEREPTAAPVYNITAAGGIVARFEQPPLWTDAERIPLVSVMDRAGNSIRLHYDASNRLSTLRDDDGRGLSFKYGDCGFLEEVRDHSDRKVGYSHDEVREHLIAVQLPATDDFPSGLLTRYEYEQPSAHIAQRHNILRIINHDGATTLQNFYGDNPADITFNRVIRQIQGGFFYDFTYQQIQWLPNEAVFSREPTMQTTTQYPDGSLWIHTFNSAGELIDERFRLNHDGSFRVVIRKLEYDSQGNLSKLVHPDGSAILRTYDDTNADPRNRANLLSIERTASPVIPVASRIIFRAEYEPRFQMVRRVTSENGAVTLIFYDLDVAPSPVNIGVLDHIEWPTATLPDGRVQTSVTRFEVNSRGQTIAAITPEGNRDELKYGPGGSTKTGFLRAYQADVGGANEVWEYDYDSVGYLKERTEPGGARRGFTHDAHGNLVNESFPIVNGVIDSVEYRYSSQGLPAEIRSPRGEFSDGVINQDYLLETVRTNPLGHVLERVLGANTAIPKKFVSQPDYRGRAIFTRDPEGVIRRTCYDERGLLLFQTDAYGTADERTIRFVYDLMGRLVRQIDPGGRITQFSYDPWGRILQTTLPNGTRTRSSWNEFDLPHMQEVVGSPGGRLPDRILRRISYDYDERGRPIRQSLSSFQENPATGVVLNEVKFYDRDGRCVRREGPWGAVWQYEYDGRARLIREIDPFNNQRSIIFAANTLPTRVTFLDRSPSGPTTRFVDYEHDARNRLIRTISSSGQQSITRYDARDLPIEKRNEVGIATIQRFGLHGELLETALDPGGLNLRYRYTYDLSARSRSYIDPTGETNTITRDNLGRPVDLHLADGSHYLRSYNEAGDLVSIATPDGSVVSMSHDIAGRVARFSVTPGAGRLPVPNHAFAYDGLDRLVRAEAAGYTVNRRFDSLDRLVEDDFVGHTFRREFDDTAAQYHLIYPDGRREEHRWDALGRVNQITLAAPGSSAVGVASGSPGDPLLSVQFRGVDRVARVDHGNGVASDWRHDREGRLIRVEHSNAGGPLASAKYRYDRANRRRIMQRTDPAQENFLFNYDGRGRLTEWRADFVLPSLADSFEQAEQDADVATAAAAATSAAQSSLYVLNGGDTRVSVDGTAYVSAPGHKVVQVAVSPIAYDLDGSRTSDSANTYIYDALGRLARIEKDGAFVSYGFDPLGRTVRTESVGTDERRFYFHSQALQLEDAAGAVVAQRTLHPLLLSHSVETRVADRLHFHANGHEDLIMVTDSMGLPRERFIYAPFGGPAVLSPAGAPLATSALGVKPVFGAMPYVEIANLYFTPRRHYDPATGLFLARDPVFFAVSPSPYVFALHDPVNYLDPAGDIPPLIVAGLIVGAIGAVIGAATVIARGGDYDAWDVLAGAGIGFGAGFIGAVTFGWAAGAIGGGALTATAGTSLAGSVTAGGVASGGVSLGTGIGAGAVSGLASGVFSGSARATYQWSRHGGDLGDMVVEGAFEEGSAGFVGGAVSGGLFQVGLRIGVVPPNAWAALRNASSATTRASVLPATLGRATIGAYGLGAAGIGFGGAYSGGLTRRLIQGESFEDASSNAVTDGLWGAGTSVAGTALHPTTWVYWRSRLSSGAAQRIQDIRAGGAHHQRNVAQYPELATPNLSRTDLTPFERFYGRNIIGGNLEGEFSRYNNRQEHIDLHELWRFGQTGSPWSIPSHGPWTPAWNVSNLPADPRPTNQTDKEN